MFFIDTEYESRLTMDPAKIMQYGEGMYDPLNSFMLMKIRDMKPMGTYTITDAEFRPDLVSHDIYGDVQYKWLLMEYNGITSYRQLTLNRQITYPALSDIEDVFSQLNALKRASET